MLHYMKSYWMASDRLPLWPMWTRNHLSNRGKYVTCGCESIFSVLKWLIFGGYRPSDIRDGCQKIWGGPDCGDLTNRRCYLQVLDTRRNQVSSRCNVKRTGDEMNERRTKVIELLRDWGLKPSRVRTLDIVRLLFMVAGSKKSGSSPPLRQSYVVSLSSSTCECMTKSMTCKHILALRVWVYLHLGIERSWNDHDLDTVFFTPRTH